MAAAKERQSVVLRDATSRHAAGAGTSSPSSFDAE
jgi:hypothetical protein